VNRYFLHIHRADTGAIFQNAQSDVPFPAFAAGNAIDLNGPAPGGNFQILRITHTSNTVPGPSVGRHTMVFHVHLDVTLAR
jgi:hypothetical protein